MPDRPSCAPKFDLYGEIWRCWIINEGQAYEWRSQCGRLFVTRNVRHWMARFETRVVGKAFPTIKIAMEAAQAKAKTG